MKKIIVLAQKELQDYFHSPMAHVVILVALSIFHVFFFIIVDQNQEATLRDMFKVMEFMFVFIVPLLTMKIFAEEKSAGTMEFLQTVPVSNGQIVLGKYLGALILFSILLLLTFVYYILMEFFANPDRGAILTGYLGIGLEGAMFLSVGLLTSSWTRNQVLAAVASYGILFFLYFSISFVKYVPLWWEGVVHYLGTWSHMENLAAGLLMTSDILYYLTTIFLCLFLTYLSIEHR